MLYNRHLMTDGHSADDVYDQQLQVHCILSHNWCKWSYILTFIKDVSIGYRCPHFLEAKASKGMHQVCIEKSPDYK